MDKVAKLLNDMVEVGIITDYAVFGAVAQMRYTEAVLTLDAFILVAVPEPDALDLLNPIWLRINKIGCNLNRRIVEDVKAANFVIHSLESHKFYSKASPTAFPLRIIKAELPDNGTDEDEKY